MSASRPVLTWDQVRGERLRRSGLVDPAPAGAEAEVAHRVCGIHAQVPSAAALSLARRVRGGTLAAYDTGLYEQRRLVKTYGPRGTLHVFPAAELDLWTAATRANPTLSRRAAQEVRLSAERNAALHEAIIELTSGAQLTRKQLAAALIDQLGDWVDEKANDAFVSGWPHWRVAVDEATAAGELCFGVPQRNQVTFVRTSDWLAETTQLPITAGGWDEPASAGTDGVPGVLLEVARRVVRTYGPITHQEFGQWLGLAAGLARRVIDALAGELTAVDVEGSRRFVLAEEDLASWAPVTESVRLLGYFDVFALGAHPREELAPRRAAEGAVPHGRGLRRSSDPARGARQFLTGPLPVLLVDGIVRGVWTAARRDGVDEARVELFGRRDRRLTALLRVEVERLSELLGRSLRLSLGPADISAHL